MNDEYIKAMAEYLFQFARSNAPDLFSVTASTVVIRAEELRQNQGIQQSIRYLKDQTNIFKEKINESDNRS